MGTLRALRHSWASPRAHPGHLPPARQVLVTSPAAAPSQPPAPGIWSTGGYSWLSASAGRERAFISTTRRWASSGGEPAPVEEISAELARDMVDAAYKADPSGGSVQLVDVREPREIQAANLGKYGWRWTALPLNSQFEEWREEVAEGELLDPEKPTLLLCHAGIRSRFVAQYLTQQCGFRQVFNITGGIDAWSSYDPEIPRY